MKSIAIITTRALFVALLTTVIFIPGQIAQAANLPGYTWLIKFDNFQDGLDGTLFIKMGEVNPAGVIEHPVVEKRFLIPCRNIGNPIIIQAGAAVFDGTNYLQCDLDLQAALEETYKACPLASGVCPTLPGKSDVLPVLFGRGEMWLAGGPPDTVSPIFYHEDFSFWYTPYGSTMDIQKTAGPETHNAVFPVAPNMWQDFMAKYQCTALPLCQYIQGAGPTTVVTPLVPDELIDFTLAPTIIEVGHNPISGEFLIGKINSLEVDPSAFGDGNG